MAGESYAIPPKDRAVEGILWYIQHHQLTGGDRLPAERVLCEVIGVSRTALRAGITRLISCGTLESRRGSGTYVCPPKPLNIFQETYNFSDAVRTAGLHPSSRLVSTETVEADEALADKLGVAAGAPLLRMQQEEGTPVFYESTIEFDKDMRFVEHCKSVILPTKFRFADNGEKNGMKSVAGEQWLKQ